MTNTLKHLSLLTRMENSGLKPRLTGKFPEDALDQACGRVETFQLQDRLRAGDDNAQIQKELVRTPEFAMLYRALCDHAADDEAISGMLQSAAACGEQLTQYPKEWVLAAAVTDLPPSLRLYYMKYYLPFIKYEEEEQAIIDNLNTFPVAEWEELSTLTEAQKNMMRQPFLGPYLFNWNNNTREALELLEQNKPLQRVLTLLYRQGVALDLNAARLKDLCWVETADVMKFRRLLAAFEYDTEDLNAFFERWLENHAGQYDLNWFISHTAPLDKGQRQEILRNDLSYLNALYSGRLHLELGPCVHQAPVRSHQHGVGPGGKYKVIQQLATVRRSRLCQFPHQGIHLSGKVIIYYGGIGAGGGPGDKAEGDRPGREQDAGGNEKDPGCQAFSDPLSQHGSPPPLQYQCSSAPACGGGF